jgi:hypothetical protein
MTRKNSRTGDGSASDSTTRRRFLRGSAGLAASAAAIPLLSGGAAAHFPPRLDIDVQPDAEENVLDLSEDETVRVLVHPVEFVDSDGEQQSFDPTDEPVRYRFGSRLALEDGGGARPKNGGQVTTVDEDGGKTKTTGESGGKATTASESGGETTTASEGEGSHEALVLTFPVAETGFDGGEETGWLYWERDESGEHGLGGFDTLRVQGEASSE